MKKDITIFDLDGTLSNADWRLKHIINYDNVPGFKKNWGAFFRGIPDDEPLEECYALAKAALPNICYLTARPENARKMSEDWLKSHDLWFEGAELFMRPAKEHKPAALVKKQIFEEQIQPKYNVLHVYDDEPIIIDMFKELGIPCTLVTHRSDNH